MNNEIKENEYEIRLDQTEKVFDMISMLIRNNETCSYRYLIYDLLGFKMDAYVPLISGLTITNMLVEYQELKKEKENERLKKPDYYEKGLIGSIKERDEIIQDYKSRIDKAIEHIKSHQLIYQSQYEELSGFDNHLLDILGEGDNND